MNIIEKTLRINCIWEVSKIEIIPKPGNVMVNIDFRNNSQNGYLKITNPLNLSFIDELIHFWDIEISDTNVTENNCLEYGRYQVELWDEDDPISEFTCDLIEYKGFGR